MFYSAKTNGFYDTDIHGKNMPKDVVEISAEEHASLMEGQRNGKIIVANDRGFPVLSEPPEPTVEEAKAECKNKAKSLLANTDWSQMSDVDVVLANKAEFDAYRAVVRDLFLRPVPNPTWPEEPTAVWSE